MSCSLSLTLCSVTFFILFLVSSFILFPKCCCCLFTHVHPLEFAWNLVRVSALYLVLEEVKGWSWTITLACCSLLICRVKLFKIKILLPLNFSIWGFPQSFPEADGGSWSCACRALRFLQRCLLPTNPAGCVLPSELPGSRKACAETVVLFGVSLVRGGVESTAWPGSNLGTGADGRDERIPSGLKSFLFLPRTL